MTTYIDLTAECLKHGLDHEQTPKKQKLDNISETPNVLTPAASTPAPLISHASALVPRPAALPVARVAKVPKTAKPSVKNSPHVLLWVCHCGLGRSHTWSNKALKVIGVYETKEAAQLKKDAVMRQYPNCGHGDILVGDSWEDEIDLVIRPAGECSI